ncbi:putative thermosensitive gluconokinase [Diaporthe ampelina]|uniref:Putative thermosensitive gluconokinase n=1 Tax=Diaporthe ampelina TaxID=1214573 RepID=A0A0G2F3P9_9PEZI|nr:putative thermosensitive gluconokinase [Diaporthe ampelina]
MPGPSGAELASPSPSHAVLLSGTHVTGKETLAVSLAKALGCPWIKAEMAHSTATFGARSQAGRGFDYGKVFGRIWSSKLQRLGFPASSNEPGDEATGQGEPGGTQQQQQQCAAVISLHHMRKPARDAIRDAMLARSVRPVFVILHITEETLSGRTLGAEEPRLAERIMAHKVADIQEPLGEERDVILVDSLRDVDALFPEIMEGVARKLQAGF